MAGKTVDDYLAGLAGWQAVVVTELRRLVRAAAPEAREAVKWAQPVYDSNGPFCYIRAFKKSVNFGFWRGVDLNDPKGLLEGEGEKMRHMKITSLEQIDATEVTRLVQEAVALNLAKGDPTKG